MTPQEKYWLESFELAVEESGYALGMIPQLMRESIAKSLARSAECQSLAFGTECIPNPLKLKISEADQRHVQEIREINELHRKRVIELEGVIQEQRYRINSLTP